MQRSIGFVLSLAILYITTGCRTPTPSFNPFAGFGSPRIPPPPTGSYGAPPDNYYPNTTPPAVSPSPITPSTHPSSASTNGQNWQPVNGRAIAANSTGSQAIGSGTMPNANAQAGFLAGSHQLNGVTAVEHTAGAPAMVPNNTNTSLARLNPMRVNDATGGMAPQRFTPPVGVQPLAPAATVVGSTLPQANRMRGYYSPTFLGSGLPPTPADPAATAGYVATGPAPYAVSNAPVATTAAVGNDGWQPKYSPSITRGTMVR